MDTLKDVLSVVRAVALASLFVTIVWLDITVQMNYTASARQGIYDHTPQNKKE